MCCSYSLPNLHLKLSEEGFKGIIWKSYMYPIEFADENLRTGM
jgi:hypothetical protein